MGACSSSTSFQDDGDFTKPPTAIADSNLISAVSNIDISTSKSKSKSNINAKHEFDPKKKATKKDSNVINPANIHTNKLNKILNSPGSLEIPEKFVKWFPPNHGHKKVRKLFKWGPQLGRGVTASVYQIEYKGQICAVKEVEKNDAWGKMLFTTEARVLSKLKHSGIISFIDMFFDDKYYYLIIEKADYDLYYVMKQKGYLSEKKSKEIGFALFKALQYMHKKKLAHRDLKPENIVFVANNPGKPRLIDFGDAEMAKPDKIYTEFVGTPPYMSPERLDEHYGWQLKKADIWALAVIIYEMYCGKRCFEGDTQKQVFGKIMRGEWSWPTNRKLPSKNMQDFISQCLKHDAKERPSAKEALAHPWFQSNRLKEMESNNNTINITNTITDVADNAPHLIQMKTRVSVRDLPDDDVNDEKEMEEINTTTIPIKKPSNDGIIKIKDFTGSSADHLTDIFENLASMVTSNRLQHILVEGYAAHLQEEDLEPFQEEFNKLDSNKDGFITGKDLINVFHSEGIGPNQAASLASIIMEQLDPEHRQTINFKQFLSARIKQQLSSKPRDAFNDILSASNQNLASGSAGNTSKNKPLQPSIQSISRINNIQNDFDDSNNNLNHHNDDEQSKSAKSNKSLKLFSECSLFNSSDEEIVDDENNYITKEHLVDFSKNNESTIKFTAKDLKEIFDEYDTDKDGKLKFSDFVQIMYSQRIVDAPVIKKEDKPVPIRQSVKKGSKKEKQIAITDDQIKNQSLSKTPPNDKNDNIDKERALSTPHSVHSL